MDFDLHSHFVSFPVQKPKEVTGSFSHTLSVEPIILCPMWQVKEHSDPYWFPLVQRELPPAGACNLGKHLKTVEIKRPKESVGGEWEGANARITLWSEPRLSP